ncbi:MAG: aldo/keto reductase, partial [Deltaproteobacteria bacterium]|nr:aldo/keto reductase [Deltaproteobacteria bacterium]
TANHDVLREPDIWEMAKRLKTGPQQVIFRFAMQIGMLPLTGTTSEQHMKDDIQVEGFELTPEETKRIEMIAV